MDSEIQRFSGELKGACARQLRIGAIGRFGFGNLGDELVLANLRAFLRPHRVIPIPLGLPEGTATARRLNAFDFVILGGGELFRSSPPVPFNNFQRWESNLKVPFGVLGLGVADLSPQFADAALRLVERSEFFLVRDEESKTFLNHSKVQVAPDLTFFRPQRPGKSAAQPREAVCGVNLRPGRPGSDDWIAAVRRLSVQTRGVPFSMHPESGDRDVLLDLDPFCPDIFPVESFGSINFLIASDFHAVVLAIQTSIPVIAINLSPEVGRIMGALGLLCYTLEWDEPARLEEAFQEAQADHEQIRSKMEAYTDRARKTLWEKLEQPRRVIQGLSRAPLNHARGLERVKSVKAAMQAGDSPGLYSNARTDERSATNWQLEVEPPSLRRQHNIGMIVDSTGVASAALKRTLESVRNQTCPVLRVVVVYGDECGNEFDGLARQYPFKQLKVEGEDLERLNAALAAVDCEYVSYVSAGSAFAEEAVGLLVQELEDFPRARGAHASYFLTHEGMIDRKIFLHRAHRPGFPAIVGPCILVRRKWAESIYQKAIDPGAGASGLGLVYNQNPLFFKPSSEPEGLIFRGILKFRRTDVVPGERLIRRALANETQKGKSILTDDLAAWLAGLARTGQTGSDPFRFVKDVIDGLDRTHGRRLRKFVRRTQAHILTAEFFALQHGRLRRQLLKKAFAILTKDPRWIQNRGFWSVLFRECLGRPKRTRERRIHRVSGELVG